MAVVTILAASRVLELEWQYATDADLPPGEAINFRSRRRKSVTMVSRIVLVRL